TAAAGKASSASAALKSVNFGDVRTAGSVCSQRLSTASTASNSNVPSNSRSSHLYASSSHRRYIMNEDDDDDEIMNM
uniref:Pecanex-like protein n=1 Tax=Macrostomum lignano TaxID=282301 RepID=A0A1I8G174_9PLAT